MTDDAEPPFTCLPAHGLNISHGEEKEVGAGTRAGEDVTGVEQTAAGGGDRSLTRDDGIDEEEMMTEEVFLLLSLRSWNRLIVSVT